MNITFTIAPGTPADVLDQLDLVRDALGALNETMGGQQVVATIVEQLSESVQSKPFGTTIYNTTPHMPFNPSLLSRHEDDGYLIK